MTSPKSRTAMRDEAASSYVNSIVSQMGLSGLTAPHGPRCGFQAGFDAATKLDDEALKIAMRSLEHYRDYNYLNEADDVRCRASEDLSKIRELRGENE